MSAIPVKIWRNLQSEVASLERDARPREILKVILLWIRCNSQHLMLEPFLDYGFDMIKDLNEDSMPVEFSSLRSSDLSNFVNVIAKRKNKEVNAIAQFLRDVVEELVTVELDKECPNCGSFGMRAFVGKGNGKLAYQCSVCGHSHYVDGARVERDGLAFATEKNLRELGVIQQTIE
ncbi:hypothetical protein GCM10007907_17660 [Chitinimonas prasina]|uniref:Transposase n=1 Tax=Chitinimonas prasina TaxID=1434937 RepID=A0ABQ5YI70_9NEIS|nr:hypothetical protein [Chitinimonas prasina]GLR12976.1 hypothetical protein GCM10007907_17660 [Chitinimonas prasina]